MGGFHFRDKERAVQNRTDQNRTGHGIEASERVEQWKFLG